jgi:hypothetical protein
MDFATLVSYHKQEGAEEMAYVTIIFTVVLGIFGYLGSAKRITKPVRLIVAGVFTVFLFSFSSSLLGSLDIHSAIHQEIRDHIERHPEEFELGTESRLYKTLLEHMVPHERRFVLVASIGLGIIVVAGLLAMGEGRVFPLRFLSTKETPPIV